MFSNAVFILYNNSISDGKMFPRRELAHVEEKMDAALMTR